MTAVTLPQFTPSFNDEDSSFAPGSLRLSTREVYYHLVNVEEHPEILPLAYDLVAQRTRTVAADAGLMAELAGFVGRSADALPELLDRLTAWRPRFAQPWRHPTDDLTRRQAFHYFTQYMPTALVDGCWLQGGLKVSTAHTPVGASLTRLYAHQLRAFIEDPGRHFVSDYRAVYGRLGAPVDEVSSHSFAERADFRDASFGLPVLLLSVGQFTRSFPGEILGVNLAWQFLDLSAFGPSLIRDVCAAYGLPSLCDDLGQPQHLEKARALARAAADQFLADVDATDRGHAWSRLLGGAIAGAAAWHDWFARTQGSPPAGPPDPRQEMLDLLWRKAPHATGYHADKTPGERRIDEQLDPRAFDGPALLDEPVAAGDTGAPAAPTWHEPELLTGRGWTAAAFRERSERLFGSCRVRELFYYLINVERYPDILPIAERYARDRLERSIAMLWKGDRPIPSRHYDPAALERWVYKKHREQVDSYRPPHVRPPAPKDGFIEVTVQLAPIVLIDGGWLQGIATPALIHTAVGRMLFHVLVEEIGAGNAAEHHANIYRDLLAAMGEAAPPVESWEFARWPRLKDESFDVPTLWLAISCFPQHFLPEILGLNLAVELAGIGGPYMEARDTLKRFGYPTLFVDVHNAADNVSAGRSAWAMNTIKRYMDEITEGDGPHSIDRTWHRVWSGVRATLPQIGRLRLVAHRIKRRFFDPDPTAIPVIFPL